LFTARSKVDLNDSSVCRLFRSNQVGKWKHEVPFDRAAEAYAAIDRGEAGLMHVALRY